MLAIELLEFLEQHKEKEVYLYDVMEDQYNPINNVRIDSEEDIVIEFGYTEE